MLKSSRSTTSITQSKKSGAKIGGDGKADYDGRCKLDIIEIGDDKVDGSEVVKDEIRKKDQKLSKSKKSSKSKKAIKFSDFFTSKAKLAFTKLRQAFVKAPILYYVNLKCHIQIEIDILGYAFNGVLSQLILHDLGQYHPVVFFSQKMILAETRYDIHDSEFLAIVETFKIWKHYLEGSQHKVFVLTDHNNFQRLMDT